MRRIIAFVLALLAATASAQIQPMPAKKPEPLKYLPFEEVKKQIAEARGLPGPEVPPPEERKRVVAEVDGEPVTLDHILDEVINRFGGQLIPGLLNQSVMSMEAIKRKIRITEEEFIESVRTFLAQKKTVDTKQSLREVLKKAPLSWSSFEKMVSDKAKIEKTVRADRNMPRSNVPLNPFVLQIWAGRKLKGQFTLELNPANLPEGILGMVKTSRLASDTVETLMNGGFTVTASKDPGGSSEITATPAGGGWPRYVIPNIPVRKMSVDGNIVDVPAAQAIRAAVEKTTGVESKRVERYLRITPAEGGASVIEVPLVQVLKQADEKSKKTAAPLTEAIEVLGKKGYTFRSDGTARPKDAEWPAYFIPVVWLTSPVPNSLLGVMKSLAGRPSSVESRFRVNRSFDLPDAPVTMVSMVDREVVLGFSFGKLNSVHYEEALESLSRFMATKQTFKAMGVEVDEKAVQTIIDAENAKFNHPLFNRKMILQAKGTSVFDEDRLLWVGNGVDQVIGTEVDEKVLRKYFQENILHFGQAMVDASHILIEAKNPKTGKADWERARRRIDEIATKLFSLPPRARPGVFKDLARQHSEDSLTAGKGGNLGPFTLRGQLAREFAGAAFALRPGEVSAPVKTVHGYHLILCNKVTPPDLKKFAFEKKETRERVKKEWQQEQRDRWLKENVQDKLKVKKVSDFFPEPK